VWNSILMNENSKNNESEIKHLIVWVNASSLALINCQKQRDFKNIQFKYKQKLFLIHQKGLNSLLFVISNWKFCVNA
jgi:hypothetical protein